jgi:regulator of cell morphogenesis and NO signaling
MVSSDYRKAGVFSRFGIDFCCGGKKTVADACREKSLDFDTVERALMLLDAKPATSVHWNFADWDPAFLIDFIVNAHHDYVRAQLPKLLKFGEKVARTHGKTWPEVVEIDALVRTVGATLSTHMMKEEQVLFPYIKKLLAGPTPQAPFGSVDNPIRVMEAEHEEAGDIMRRIRALSNGYAPPEGACNTFRVWYAMLQEFEEDLHLHVHLENNILFPRAIALEHTEISRQV